MEKSSSEPIRSTAELAERLGLSRWTVSRALNGHGEIRAETAARVQAAAREAGFAPDVFGRGLRAGRTNWVGVGLPDLVDYFLTNKLTRLQATLHEAGLQSVVQIMEPTAAGERDVIERFLAMRCSAVVLIASRLPAGDARLEALERAGVAFVRIDPAHPGSAREVSTDRAHATRAIVRRLHALGHRRLVLAGIDSAGTYGRQRMAGVRRGCVDCGWNFARDIVALNAAGDATDDFARGFRLGGEFVTRLAGRHSAVLALNDRVAMGILRAGAEAGLRVPRDVSIVGYDDADFSRFTDPPLTTVDPQVDALIDRAVRMLGEDQSKKIRHATVKPRLIERESIGPAPRGR